MKEQHYFVSIARRTKVVEIGILERNSEAFRLVQINPIDNCKCFGVAIRTPDEKTVCELVGANDDTVTVSFVYAGIKWMLLAYKDTNSILITIDSLVEM